MALKISNEQLAPDDTDRFARFRLIGWWDQTRLANAKILVVGAGALGNEIIKNLALLGIGNLLVLDLDRIENSNLSRSVLYRTSDNGRNKAETAARAAVSLYPDMKVHFINGNMLHDVGMGVFHWADLVIGGLDNREARLAINRHCYRLGKPWIDGAIEQIQGVARVFVPDGPCYECTMSETDWKILQKRKSCNLLTRDEMEGGKTPTTPTISSIIAGVQCQEAVKLLHGLPSLAGKGWHFQGSTCEAWTVDYQRKEDCYSHDPLESVVSIDAGIEQLTAADLLANARSIMGSKATLEFARDMVEKLVCPGCGFEEYVYCALTQVRPSQAGCPHCDQARREVVTFFQIKGDESFINRTLHALGVPPFDIVIGRTCDRAIGLKLSGDADAVLGPVAR